MSTRSNLRVGVLVFDGVEELDVVGPWHVLATWARGSALHPDVLTFSADGGGVRCARGLGVVPDTSAEDVGPLSVLVHPGGRGARTLVVDEAHLAWLRAMRARTPVMASVCTGALVYAAAGLLAGRPATTHHASLDALVRADPSVLVDAEARFVDDGDVITSAGTSAGIDMALHLVARMESPDAARALCRDMEYEPAPGG